MKFLPFSTVENYPQMLSKISIFTFVASAFALYLLRIEIRPLDQALAPYSLNLTISGLSFELPFGTIVPALVLALIFRMVKLHDRVSDLLRIRKRFDVYKILIPMALATGANLSISRIKKLEEKRHELMNNVFYKYASGTKEKAQIDPHYITMALDQWSWYWIIIEIDVVAGISSIILFATGKPIPTFWLLAGILCSIALLQFILKSCTVYAFQEIEQILGDEKRKQEIRKTFNAI